MRRGVEQIEQERPLLLPVRGDFQQDEILARDEVDQCVVLSPDHAPALVARGDELAVDPDFSRAVQRAGEIRRLRLRTGHPHRGVSHRILARAEAIDEIHLARGVIGNHLPLLLGPERVGVILRDVHLVLGDAGLGSEDFLEIIFKRPDHRPLALREVHHQFGNEMVRRDGIRHRPCAFLQVDVDGDGRVIPLGRIERTERLLDRIDLAQPRQFDPDRAGNRIGGLVRNTQHEGLHVSLRRRETVLVKLKRRVDDKREHVEIDRRILGVPRLEIKHRVADHDVGRRLHREDDIGLRPAATVAGALSGETVQPSGAVARIVPWKASVPLLETVTVTLSLSNAAVLLGWSACEEICTAPFGA